MIKDKNHKKLSNQLKNKPNKLLKKARKIKTKNLMYLEVRTKILKK
jgi:hypothetical protein